MSFNLGHRSHFYKISTFEIQMQTSVPGRKVVKLIPRARQVFSRLSLAPMTTTLNPRHPMIACK